jgi:hypothetical protein
MGYILGSNIALAFGDWRWSLRFTPILGFLCAALLILFYKDPKRGTADGSTAILSNNSFFTDLKYLFKK